MCVCMYVCCAMGFSYIIWARYSTQYVNYSGHIFIENWYYTTYLWVEKIYPARQTVAAEDKLYLVWIVGTV